MTGGMGRPADAYRPRDPAASALYHVVRDHFETFRAHAAGLRDDEGLPGFVEEEFRNFLRCGWLAGGFARLRCTRCRTERLVAFSCKGRGFCPSCGGRRMVERAATNSRTSSVESASMRSARTRNTRSARCTT
jgi:hypothetical protein